MGSAHALSASGLCTTLWSRGLFTQEARLLSEDGGERLQILAAGLVKLRRGVPPLPMTVELAEDLVPENALTRQLGYTAAKAG